MEGIDEHEREREVEPRNNRKNLTTFFFLFGLIFGVIFRWLEFAGIYDQGDAECGEGSGRFRSCRLVSLSCGP
jgi:hypothetical protein